jgi:hypothetical protein
MCTFSGLNLVPSKMLLTSTPTIGHALVSSRSIFFLNFGLAYQGKHIVFKFITEYSSLRDFGPLGNIGSIFIRGLLKDDILAGVET